MNYSQHSWRLNSEKPILQEDMDSPDMQPYAKGLAPSSGINIVIERLDVTIFPVSWPNPGLRTPGPAMLHCFIVPSLR